MNITHCGVCNSTSLSTVWRLPALPFTERFGPYDPTAAATEEQSLLHCQKCHHVQLENQVSPSRLYDNSYSFRTAQSKSAAAGTAIFLSFLKEITQGRSLNHAVDIGGNDLFLAKQLKPMAAATSVIDPICGQHNGQSIDGVRIFGKLIEEVDLSQDMPQPDLVTCRHTLEHLGNPNQFFQQLFRQCRNDCIYIFEIPSFECLLEGLRFDAIFHQHLHYFSVPVLQKLVLNNGGTWLGHRFNFQGSCGGSLLFACSIDKISGHQSIQDDISSEFVSQRIAAFQEQMRNLSLLLRSLAEPVFGYGGGLMLATLAYHLQTDFRELVCILDDDPEKDGLTYVNVPVHIRYTGKQKIPENSNFLITSWENIRPIYGRLLSFKPRRILAPLIS